MKTKHLVFALALAGASTLQAAGVTWSYEGQTRYDAALIVWTDPGINTIGAEDDIRGIRTEVLKRLSDSALPITLAELASQCEKTGIGNVILAQIVEPPLANIRVRHGLGYIFDHTGWGFSLLVKLNDKQNITEYAINEVTKATIVSEAVKDTDLTIYEDDLTPALSAYASTRLASAGTPDIVAHELMTRMMVNQEPETFVFDITNAVSGVTYRVIGTNDLALPFVPIGVDAIATIDGRLSFTIPINPTEKVMFYRVSAGQ